MKKRIGITFSRTNYAYYPAWFNEKSLEEDFEVVELSFLQPNIHLLHRCDALVLSGGVDMQPACYGGLERYPNMPEAFEPERDAFEAQAYAYAKSRSLPVLGICRGMQLVNILEGGSMLPDLGPAGNALHRKASETDKRHLVQLLPGSLLQEACGCIEGVVNSAHHQAIDPVRVGHGLRVTAWSEDGIPEALEAEDGSQKPFLLCVQWHPERMADKQENPLSYRVRQRFLESVIQQSHRRMEIVNPATEEVIASLVTDTPQTLEQKAMRLRKAQPHWASKSLEERRNILSRFRDLLTEEKEALAADLTAEVGKPLQQSRNEIEGARTRIAWMLNHAQRYLSDEVMSTNETMEERIRYEPLGLVCNISAWNYPYLVGVNVFIPALLAGNAVLYKPSEHASLTGLQIDRLLKASGIPEDVFQTAVGAGEIGEALLHLSFDGWFFTGSYRTGKHVYASVASQMAVCQCELGGKDPLYVADDVADISAVAAATADGAFYNNGQSCCAVERIYVHEKVYEAYLEAFVKEVRTWRMGDPLEEGIYLGPLARKDNLQVLEAQVADALSKGGRLLCGGKRAGGKGYYFEPTVIADADNSMWMMREESFGPIIGIQKVTDDEQAVRLMQDTDYGLTAAVYTSDNSRGERILTELDTGTGYINCCDRVSAALPWSGRKHSGFGATLSHQGLRAFTKTKGLHVRKGEG
ncbi:MAG: aldehyde dehydrogenase family protein [Bacteroidetes bacterium]|nr:aldehyde dehydrogenase family protein [Bacteroidota bacterium]